MALDFLTCPGGQQCVLSPEFPIPSLQSLAQLDQVLEFDFGPYTFPFGTGTVDLTFPFLPFPDDFPTALPPPSNAPLKGP